MKKFLFIVLIAIVVSSNLDVYDELILNGLPDWLVNGWNKIKEYFKKAKQWLVENGFWEPLKKTVEKYGRQAGMKACIKILEKEEPCKTIVDGIIDILNKLVK